MVTGILRLTGLLINSSVWHSKRYAIALLFYVFDPVTIDYSNLIGPCHWSSKGRLLSIASH
jgi:hypothetical protein